MLRIKALFLILLLSCSHLEIKDSKTKSDRSEDLLINSFLLKAIQAKESKQNNKFSVLFEKYKTLPRNLNLAIKESLLAHAKKKGGLAAINDLAKVYADLAFYERNKLDLKEESIESKFALALNQLVADSKVPIGADSIAGTLPVSYDDSTLESTANYLGEQLLLSVIKLGKFKVMDSNETSEILNELRFKKSLGLDGHATQVDELLGAKFLVNSKLYKRGKDFELFLKLLDVETGQVLSATKLAIQKELVL